MKLIVNGEEREARWRRCSDCGEQVFARSHLGRAPKLCEECKRRRNLESVKSGYARRKEVLEGREPAEEKQCKQCKEVKTSEFFSRHSANPDGLQHYCKMCQSEYQRANREMANERGRRFRARRPGRSREYFRQARWQALVHYSASDAPECACCGENEPKFLVLDHIHGGGTAHRRELGGSKIWTWLRANGYPDGFQVLCWNCNAAKAYYGTCPHQVVRIEVAS
jgi:hypothetical protein